MSIVVFSIKPNPDISRPENMTAAESTAWHKSMDRLGRVLNETLLRYFEDYKAAEAAMQSYKDIIDNFQWDFPTDTPAGMTAKNNMLGIAISQDKAAKAWESFIFEGNINAAGVCLEEDIIDQETSVSIEAKFIAGAEGGPGPRAKFNSSTKGGSIDIFVEDRPVLNSLAETDFWMAVEAFSKAQFEDNKAYLCHDPRKPTSMQKLIDAQRNVDAAWQKVVQTAQGITAENAEKLGVLSVWKKAQTPEKPAFDAELELEEPLSRDNSCAWGTAARL